MLNLNNCDDIITKLKEKNIDDNNENLYETIN